MREGIRLLSLVGLIFALLIGLCLVRLEGLLLAVPFMAVVFILALGAAGAARGK